MSDRYSLLGVGNDQLLASLIALVRRGNALTADVLAHLAEVDGRRLYTDAGFSSLFAYCTERLGMCESMAGRHIAAARVGRRYPQVFARVARGELSLSALCAVSPHLNQENAAGLFAACTGKSRRRVEELLAARFPQADVRESVRLKPLSVDRYAVQFTADAEFRDLLEQARALASHQLPGGEVPELLKLALRAFVATTEKRRFGVGRRARVARPAQGASGTAQEHRAVPGDFGPHPPVDSSAPASSSAQPVSRARRQRHVPAQVAREVYARDLGECGFVSKDGRRCGARVFLELDHVLPVAVGGASVPENLRLRCRAHNALHARCYFGRRWPHEALSKQQVVDDSQGGVVPQATGAWS